MTDELDRQIVAALIRNGRAPFRLIAEVLGQQERTVSRRANKLLASGLLRVQSFPNPTALARVDLYMLQVDIEPPQMESVAGWLAQCQNTHWISSLTGASRCVVEVFLPQDKINEFLYEQLARVEGVRNFSLEPVFEYFRTVSGWHPDILSREQYDRLSPPEDPGYVTGYASSGPAALDDSQRSLITLLRDNGRLTIDEMAKGLGVSKATASRKIESLINDGVLFVRAVLDPADIGYPVEGLITIEAGVDELERVGRHLADLASTRWAVNVAGRLQIQSAVRNLAEFSTLTSRISALEGVTKVDFSLFAKIYKRTTVAYRQGKLPEL